jgi:hypothetical protein
MSVCLNSLSLPGNLTTLLGSGLGKFAGGGPGYAHSGFSAKAAPGNKANNATNMNVLIENPHAVLKALRPLPLIAPRSCDATLVPPRL